MRIVTQTRAMPGYTNMLRYTFTKPGICQVLWPEYCGLGHHDMNAEINVTASNGCCREEIMTIGAIACSPRRSGCFPVCSTPRWLIRSLISPNSSRYPCWSDYPWD